MTPQVPKSGQMFIKID